VKSMRRLTYAYIPHHDASLERAPIAIRNSEEAHRASV
jgi:hypothetical protein